VGEGWVKKAARVPDGAEGFSRTARSRPGRDAEPRGRMMRGTWPAFVPAPAVRLRS
jgi:hypothetical protein